jgi:hypothetical protein
MHIVPQPASKHGTCSDADLGKGHVGTAASAVQPSKARLAYELIN